VWRSLQTYHGARKRNSIKHQGNWYVSAEWLLGVGPIVCEHAPELAQVGLVLAEFVAALVTLDLVLVGVGRHMRIHGTFHEHLRPHLGVPLWPRNAAQPAVKHWPS
jgi:hypothetical protein